MFITLRKSTKYIQRKGHGNDDDVRQCNKGSFDCPFCWCSDIRLLAQISSIYVVFFVHLDKSDYRMNIVIRVIYGWEKHKEA